MGTYSSLRISERRKWWCYPCRLKGCKMELHGIRPFENGWLQYKFRDHGIPACLVYQRLLKNGHDNRLPFRSDIDGLMSNFKFVR